ncbi:flagellar assembly protein T N-terminal domain-containing protein [Rheinheimera gaetbuli]
MKYYAFCLILISPIFLSSNAQAQWYEAIGQAKINNNELTSARQLALEDAIKRAALGAGARVSSTQQLINGVLQNEQTELVSMGEIKQIRLLSETRSSDMLTVTVQLNIQPEMNQCGNHQYKKSVLMPLPQLIPRRDAVNGQLFDFGSNIGVQLERHLRDYSPAAIVSLVQYSIEPKQLQFSRDEQLFNDGNQYLLNSRITDLSLGETTNKFWQAERKERFFALEVSLYDIFEQKIVYQQEYRTSADWPVRNEPTPSSHSQAFWQMEYGSNINKLLQTVADDVQQQLNCQPLRSRIAQVRNNTLQLPLGTMHGLKIGDELRIFQLQRHPATPDVRRVLQHAARFTVTEITSQHAWASSEQQHLLSHIQQGDIVSIQLNPDDI